MASHDSSEVRFADYVAALVRVIGHADRATPLRDYCTGLLMPAERKSVEPMAAITAPARVAAQHQSLLHFVGQAPWSDTAVLTKVRDLVLPAIERAGPIEAWIIDDTSFPKKGRHSVGVARQYCGQLGKQDNCQVAVTLSLAHRTASLPVAYRLYLPQEWADDPARRIVGNLFVKLAAHPFEHLGRTAVFDNRNLLAGHHAVINDEGDGNQQDAARHALAGRKTLPREADRGQHDGAHDHGDSEDVIGGHTGGATISVGQATTDSARKLRQHLQGVILPVVAR